MKDPGKGREPTWGLQLRQGQGWGLLVEAQPAGQRRRWLQVGFRSPRWGARCCPTESPQHLVEMTLGNITYVLSPRELGPHLPVLIPRPGTAWGWGWGEE